MNKMANTDLIKIIEKFAKSGWDLIDVPAKKWLANDGSYETTADLLKAIEQADKDCGSCGCEFDLLYKKSLGLLRAS